jgi:hypothetical protein
MFLKRVAIGKMQPICTHMADSSSMPKIFWTIVESLHDCNFCRRGTEQLHFFQRHIHDFWEVVWGDSAPFTENADWDIVKESIEGTTSPYKHC